VAKGRTTWVDTARGIGIILVVYGHVIRGLENGGILTGSTLFRFQDDAIYSFHMPLFFFLSGMFFLGSYRKQGLDLFATKAAVIVYPYFVWSIIQVGIKIGLAGYANSPVGYKSLVSIFWLPVEQFWFLYSLFLITTVHLVFFVITDRLPLLQKYRLQLILSLALLLYFARPLFPGIFQIQTVATYMIYFSLGLGFSAFHPAYPGGRPVLAIPFCFLFLCYLIHFEHYWPGDSVFLQLMLAVSGLGSVLVLSPCAGKRITAILSFLGRYSMEIFCIHIIAGSGIRILLLHLLQISNPAVHLAAGFIGSLLLPVVFVRLLSKFAMDRFFFESRFFRPLS
jgi:fucose 4-O-acetylase-like acetyltransferase